MSHATVLVALDEKTAINEFEAAVAYQLKPFDENNECFRDGSRWDWWVIGGRWGGHFLGHNYVRKREMIPDDYRKDRTKRCRKTYDEAQEEEAKSPKAPIDFLYGVVPSQETLDAYVARSVNGWFPTTQAFLATRHWHEPSRMGWFGTETATECERYSQDPPKVCHLDDGEAKLTTYNMSDDEWEAEFYAKFIAPLPDNTWLVVVDYHV